MDTPPILPPVTPPPVPPPLPAPKKPEGFNLSRWVWIAWGVYAAIAATVFMLRPGEASPERVGEMIGATVGALIFPGLIALLAWRLGGRSAKAGNTAFLVVFGLVACGQVSQFLRRAEANAALARVRQEQQQFVDEQRAALAKGKPLDDAKAVRIAEKVRDSLGVMADNSAGGERNVAEAAKALIEEILAANKKYEAAAAKLNAAHFWDLTKFVPGEPAETRRQAVRSFSRANENWARYYDDDATQFQRLLAEHGVTAAAAQNAVAGYKQSAGARVALIRKIRDTDARLAQTMLDFVDFADLNREHWHIEAASGKIIFGDNDLLDRYNQLIKRVNTVSAEQAGLKKQFVAAKIGP